MGFWTKFAEKKVRKILGLENKNETFKFPPERCKKCGKMFPFYELVNQICFQCKDETKADEAHAGHQSFRESTSVNDLDHAYKILGCNKDDSNDQIKKRYRSLIKECHTDSLPKGLPDYLVEAANRRFHMIQEAYEKIMESRNSR